MFDVPKALVIHVHVLQWSLGTTGGRSPRRALLSVAPWDMSVVTNEPLDTNVLQCDSTPPRNSDNTIMKHTSALLPVRTCEISDGRIYQMHSVDVSSGGCIIN